MRFGRKTTPGSRFLRSILAQAVGRAVRGDLADTVYFDGTARLQPSPQEAALLDMLAEGSMPEIRAKGILLSIKEAVITSREQVVEAVAALTSLFPDEVKRKATAGQGARVPDQPGG